MRARPVIVLCLLVAATACTNGGDAATTTTAALPRADCDPPRAAIAPGENTFTFGGEDRKYLLHLPDGYEGRTFAPLAFNFHGFASNGAAQDINTSMGGKGGARGFVVVTPTSDPPQWNAFGAPGAADDFGFVRALITELETKLCVDANRVYAAGHSNGSAFVGFLACKAPPPFRAIAMVSGTIPSLCPPGEGPSVLVIAGTADPQVPYGGGTVTGSTIQIPAVLDTMKAYGEHYHCTSEPVPDAPIEGVDRLTYTGCDKQTGLVVDTIVGGTHEWPGGVTAHQNAADSTAGQQFDATAAVLDFFTAH